MLSSEFSSGFVNTWGGDASSQGHIGVDMAEMQGRTEGTGQRAYIRQGMLRTFRKVSGKKNVFQPDLRCWNSKGNAHKAPL